MTTPVKQLKDENDVAFYPHTVKAAISDFTPVQTDDIADEAVTADKIDFTTLGVATAYTSATGTLSGNSKISMTAFLTNNGGYSLSSGGVKVASAGIYEIEAEVTGLFTENTGWIEITKNGSTTNIATGINRTAEQSFNSVHVSKIAVSLAANDVIYLYTADAIQGLNGGIGERTGTYITVKKVS